MSDLADLSHRPRWRPVPLADGNASAKEPLARFAVLSLLLFVLLLTFDGAIRKWLLPGSRDLVLILKDAGLVLAVAYVAMRSRGQLRTQVPTPVLLALGAYIGWVLLEAFNPHTPNVRIALWGIKAHIVYAGLIILLPVAFTDIRAIISSLRWVYPLLTLPVCLLAIAQVGLPADHVLNGLLYAEDDLTSFGKANLVRVSGTFSYLSGMAAFAQVMALVGFALVLAGVRNILVLLALGSVVLALPASGTRAVLYIVVIGSTILLAAAAAARTASTKAIALFVVAVCVFTAASLTWQSDSWTALQDRLEDGREEGRGRMIIALTSMFDFIEVAGMTGYGPGTASFGAVALAGDIRPFSWFPPGIGFEEEQGRLVLELGWVGLVLSLTMRVFALAWATHLVLAGRTSAVRAAAVLTLPFMTLAVYQGNGVFGASYMAVIYWFCFGLLGMAQMEHRSGIELR